MKAKNPSWGVGDIAKELGKKWEVCSNRAKFEALAAKDKKRYEAVSTSQLLLACGRVLHVFQKCSTFCSKLFSGHTLLHPTWPDY